MMHGSTNIKYGIELYVMRPKQLNQSVSQKRDAKNADSKKLHFATSYPLFIYCPSNVTINNSEYIASVLGMINEWRIEMDMEEGGRRLFHTLHRHPPGD
jgi:hypothetical protein